VTELEDLQLAGGATPQGQDVRSVHTTSTGQAQFRIVGI